MRVNAKYYGWRLAVYIAGVMYVSIVVTALSLHGLFSLLSITPQSGRKVGEIVAFKVDYTFYLNVFFSLVAAAWIILSHRMRGEGHDGMKSSGWVKKTVSASAALILVIGFFIRLVF